MLGLLARRHAAVNQFGFPRWVYAEKVYANRYGREVDAIALDGHSPPWSECPLANQEGEPSWARVPVPNDVHGYEVKVSRSDWLREARTDGGKSFPWRRYCSHWWLVVPDAGIVRDGELPDGWGLLTPTKAGVLRAQVPARRVTAEPIPHELHILIGRAAIRTRDRHLTRDDGGAA